MFKETLLPNFYFIFPHHLNHISPPLQLESLSILILCKVAAETRQSIFNGNCNANVKAVPQMENEIHWRKIMSSTSIWEKNDGHKADTQESIVLPVVIAPAHLKPLPLDFMSQTASTTVLGLFREAVMELQGNFVLGKCLGPDTGLLCCVKLVAAFLQPESGCIWLKNLQTYGYITESSCFLVAWSRLRRVQTQQQWGS